MTPGLQAAAMRGRRAAQATAVALHTGSQSERGQITLPGRPACDAAISISGLGPFQLEGGGQIIAQTLVAMVSKDVCPSPPALGDTLTHHGKGWKVQRLAGHDALAQSWVITCTRQPGTDV